MSINAFFKLTIPHSLEVNNLAFNVYGDALYADKNYKQSNLCYRFFLYYNYIDSYLSYIDLSLSHSCLFYDSNILTILMKISFII